VEGSGDIPQVAERIDQAIAAAKRGMGRR
jgi:hypothetical protein